MNNQTDPAEVEALAEDERKTLNWWLPVDFNVETEPEFAAAVSRIIAARVAKAKAEALEEAAGAIGVHVGLGGVYILSTNSYGSAADWLRARAAAARGPQDGAES